jgi:hypothetical protein
MTNNINYNKIFDDTINNFIKFFCDNEDKYKKDDYKLIENFVITNKDSYNYDTYDNHIYLLKLIYYLKTNKIYSQDDNIYNIIKNIQDDKQKLVNKNNDDEEDDNKSKVSVNDDEDEEEIESSINNNKSEEIVNDDDENEEEIESSINNNKSEERVNDDEDEEENVSILIQKDNKSKDNVDDEEDEEEIESSIINNKSKEIVNDNNEDEDDEENVSILIQKDNKSKDSVDDEEDEEEIESSIINNKSNEIVNDNNEDEDDEDEEENVSILIQKDNKSKDSVDDEEDEEEIESSINNNKSEEIINDDEEDEEEIESSINNNKSEEKVDYDDEDEEEIESITINKEIEVINKDSDYNKKIIYFINILYKILYNEYKILIIYNGYINITDIHYYLTTEYIYKYDYSIDIEKLLNIKNLFNNFANNLIIIINDTDLKIKYDNLMKFNEDLIITKKNIDNIIEKYNDLIKSLINLNIDKYKRYKNFIENYIKILSKLFIKTHSISNINLNFNKNVYIINIIKKIGFDLITNKIIKFITYISIDIFSKQELVTNYCFNIYKMIYSLLKELIDIDTILYNYYFKLYNEPVEEIKFKNDIYIPQIRKFKTFYITTSNLTPIQFKNGYIFFKNNIFKMFIKNDYYIIPYNTKLFFKHYTYYNKFFSFIKKFILFLNKFTDTTEYINFCTELKNFITQINTEIIILLDKSSNIDDHNLNNLITFINLLGKKIDYIYDSKSLSLSFKSFEINKFKFDNFKYLYDNLLDIDDKIDIEFLNFST